jgi:regulator of cell morphogenesis and NO signaling
MRITAETPVEEIAAGVEGAIEVFEEREIDYCLGGPKTLREACDQAGVRMNEILAALERWRRRSGHDRSWRPEEPSVTSLIDHLLRRQHDSIRLRFARVCQEATVLMREGQGRDAVFPLLKDLVHEMAFRTEQAMEDEEHQLFPRLKGMERVKAGIPGSGPAPALEPELLTRIAWNHGSMSEEWAFLRKLTGDYRGGPGTSGPLLAFYRELEALEGYLHDHAHLEDDLLFRRVEQMDPSRPHPAG